MRMLQRLSLHHGLTVSNDTRVGWTNMLRANCCFCLRHQKTASSATWTADLSKNYWYVVWNMKHTSTVSHNKSTLGVWFWWHGVVQLMVVQWIIHWLWMCSRCIRSCFRGYLPQHMTGFSTRMLAPKSPQASPHPAPWRSSSVHHNVVSSWRSIQ